jgi:hypothetical protein
MEGDRLQMHDIFLYERGGAAITQPGICVHRIGRGPVSGSNIAASLPPELFTRRACSRAIMDQSIVIL